MKTKDPHKNKTLCTVWNGQLVIPGTKRETKKSAVGYWADSEKLTGVEQWWSDAKLKSLPEYDG
jgi:hypothetical protein